MEKTHDLTAKNKVLLIVGYLRKFIENPKYFNAGIFDVVSAFVSFYIRRKDYFQFFDYVNWSETQVDETNKENYEWEGSKESTSTWRVGDGTAAFYNFAYLQAAGFNEYDTFRSNQIRSGQMSREEGLRRALEEGLPQTEEFVTYAQTSGIDPLVLVDAISRIPERY
jgi:hypothetical protein